MQDGGEFNNTFAMFDYLEEDSATRIRIFESIDYKEILFRRPDYYYYDKEYNNLVYVHTENYVNATDSAWLNEILYQTLDFLKILHNFSVDWEKNEIIIAETEKTLSGIYTFDPAAMEFTFIHGEFLDKKQ